jgi:hypothetical protein
MGESEKKTTQSSSGNIHHKKTWNNNHKKKRYANKPAVRPEKFQGGKNEWDGNYFDCTGYGQSDRFVKMVQKIADYIGQEYKCGGVTRIKVTTQTKLVITMPARPVGRTSTAADGTVTSTPPDSLDISDYQSEKKTADYKIQHQTENRQKIFSLVWQQCRELIQAKVKAHREYQVIEQTLDGVIYCKS